MSLNRSATYCSLEHLFSNSASKEHSETESEDDRSVMSLIMVLSFDVDAGSAHLIHAHVLREEQDPVKGQHVHECD